MRVTCRQYSTLVALDRAVRAAGQPVTWSTFMRVALPVWRDEDAARTGIARAVAGGLVSHVGAGYRVALEARALLEREHACQTCRPRVTA